MGFLTIFYKYIIKSHYSRRWLSCPTWEWGGGVGGRQCGRVVGQQFICRILQESPHLQSHLSSLTYDIQIHDVICVSLLNISRKPPPGASCFLNLQPQVAIAFISV